MIKPVEEIPKNEKQKRKSQRDMLREDIQAGIEKGLELFEFVGDGYNYKYLAQYAREEARYYVAHRLKRKYYEYKRAGNEVPNGVTYGDFEVYSMNYLEIIASKDEEGKNHVYCRVHKDGLDKLWNEIVLPKLKNLIERKRKREFEKAHGAIPEAQPKEAQV